MASLQQTLQMSHGDFQGEAQLTGFMSFPGSSSDPHQLSPGVPSSSQAVRELKRLGHPVEPLCTQRKKQRAMDRFLDSAAASAPLSACLGQDFPPREIALHRHAPEVHVDCGPPTGSPAAWGHVLLSTCRWQVEEGMGDSGEDVSRSKQSKHMSGVQSSASVHISLWQGQTDQSSSFWDDEWGEEQDTASSSPPEWLKAALDLLEAAEACSDSES